MTQQQPPELFASRPVRSDFARMDYRRERSYARRRVVTVCVLLLIIGGTIYGIWGHSPRNPADIPTVKAEGAYKEKPADPGGIDIPHQDVQVYDSLEDKPSPASQVEHLLPPPETPQPVTHAVSPLATTPSVAPVAPQPVSSSASLTSSVKSTGNETTAAPIDILPSAPAKKIPTTVTKQAPPKPLAPLPAAKTLTIEDVLKDTETPATKSSSDDIAPEAVSTPTPLTPSLSSPSAVAHAGNVAVQLASSTDEGKAKVMAQELQQKYAGQLGTVQLRVVRADLGVKGVYYRIQGQGLAEDNANRICSALKQMKAGCILVRK